MEEIRFRLIKDNKIVGYETWNKVNGWIYSYNNIDWNHIEIEHDCKNLCI